MANNVLGAYLNKHELTDKVVLATIVETFGSSYQKAGTRMLITEQGETIGLLSGGCFESDLREQAKSVFEQGIARVVFYDMRSPDDAIWGLGLGCNGAVRVLLQLLTRQNDYYPLDKIADVNKNNQPGVLITMCESEHNDYLAGDSIFLEATQENSQYSVCSEHEQFGLHAQRLLSQGRSELIKQRIDGQTVSVFYAILKPPLRLLLLGASLDAVPISQFAKSLGWHVSIVDHRPDAIKPECFPNVDQLLNITPRELNKQLSLDQFDAVVVMTHNIDYDERYLNVIADCKITYIGLLGPAKRRDRLMDNLADQAAKLSGRLYGPVGLDIGAKSPEEIALSIVAEIQAVISKRDGGHLYQKQMPQHEMFNN